MEEEGGGEWGEGGFRDWSCWRSEAQLFPFNPFRYETVGNDVLPDPPDAVNSQGNTGVKRKTHRCFKSGETFKGIGPDCLQSVGGDASSRHIAVRSCSTCSAGGWLHVSTRPPSSPSPTTQTGCDTVGPRSRQATSPCLLCGHKPCAPSWMGEARRRGSQSQPIASGQAECVGGGGCF